MAFLCSGTCDLLETCIFFKTRVVGDWYTYTALDMGWEFTGRIKLTCKDGNIIIEDMDLTE